MGCAVLLAEENKKWGNGEGAKNGEQKLYTCQPDAAANTRKAGTGTSLSRDQPADLKKEGAVKHRGPTFSSSCIHPFNNIRPRLQPTTSSAMDAFNGGHFNDWATALAGWLWEPRADKFGERKECCGRMCVGTFCQEMEI